MLELLVRIEKVLERTGRAKKVLTVRNILVDMQSHQVYKDGLPVSLKPMEYDLFVLLLQNKNIALGREELLKRVWGRKLTWEKAWTVDVQLSDSSEKSWNFMMRSGRSRNLDTVWRNKDEAVETNGTSYAGNAIMCPDPSGNAKYFISQENGKPQ